MTRTGLERFVGASDGTQPQVTRQVEEASGAERREDSVRWAPGRPAKDITWTKDETCTGGLGLVGMDPGSHASVVAQAAPARAPAPWQAGLEPALAGRTCRVMPATSDEAPGRLASVEHPRGAQHSPDLCQGPQARVKAVAGPLATPPRAAGKAASEAHKRLAQVPGQLQRAGGEPQPRGPGRPPKATASRAPREQEAAGARPAPQRLSAPREPGA